MGLREDGSGLLISVSRGISKATDMKIAAMQLRDEINQIRIDQCKTNIHKIQLELKDYQKEFIDFSLSSNVLQVKLFYYSIRIYQFFARIFLYNTH